MLFPREVKKELEHSEQDYLLTCIYIIYICISWFKNILFPCELEVKFVNIVQTSALQRHDFGFIYITCSLLIISIATVKRLSVKGLIITELVSWIVLRLLSKSLLNVVTTYELGLEDAVLLIAANVLTKWIICRLKTFLTCFTNIKHSYKKKMGYTFKIVFILELLFHVVCWVFMFKYCISIPRATLTQFHPDNGTTIHETHSLEKNDCIGYKDFIYLEVPPGVKFKTVENLDILRTSNYYYTDSVKKMTVFEESSIVSSENMFKNYMKLCKMTPGHVFHLYIRRPDIKDVKGLNFKWYLNGTEIDRLWESQQHRYRYKQWVDYESCIPTIHLQLLDILSSDVGLYHVMVTRSVESYQCSKLCFQNAILMNIRNANCDIGPQIERFKAGKFYIVDYSQGMESVIRDIQLGTLLNINNVFNFSYYNKNHVEHDRFINKSYFYLINNPKFLVSDVDYWLTFQKSSIEKLCPPESSCLPSIDITQRPKSIFTTNFLTEGGVITTKVNVSLCMCPEAYGYLQLYRNDGFSKQRASPTIQILPKFSYYYKKDLHDMFYKLSNLFKGYYQEILHTTLMDASLYKLFIEDMYKLFYRSYLEEIRYGTWLFVWYSVVFCLVVGFVKRASYILTHLRQFQRLDIWNRNQLLRNYKYHVFLSVSEDPDNTYRDHIKLVTDICQQMKVNVFYCSEDNLGVGERVPQYRNLMTNSRTVIILLSQEYVRDERCYHEQVRVTLSSLVKDDLISTEGVLVIKAGELTTDIPDILRMFRQLSWTDLLTTKEEKQEQLSAWFKNRLLHNDMVLIALKGIVEFINVICFFEF